MKRTVLYLIAMLGIVISFSRCAKKGSPDGGPKDTIPPIIVKSNPENYVTNFEGDEIRVYFDEFIKLKDLQQNLIVSPPLKYQPVVSPITSAKVLKIKILDTLKANTTYVFNFGNSIVDNNEGNVFPYFKYVFSTGDYIDSLRLKGRVTDLEKPTLEKKAIVMLYELNEAFTDSIIYLEKPTYVTTTKEKDPSFELTNLKEGDYIMIALQEEINNYVFDPKKEKIAFRSEPIHLPQDSIAQLNLFKEEAKYAFTRASHVGKNKIAFGYEGRADSLKIELQSQVASEFESRILKDPTKDSLNYWFKPALDPEVTDTLIFTVRYQTQVDTVPVRIRDLYADSLTVKLSGSNRIIPRDSIHIVATTPLDSVFAEKFSVMNQDSVFLEKEVLLDTLKNRVSVVFDKTDESSYRIELQPKALVDYFGNTSDSLAYTVRTLAQSDYGTINFRVNKLKSFPVIIQLVDKNQQIIAKDYLTENRDVYFDYLTPNTYYLRIMYDTNKNGKWDTGSYLDKRQPETIVYYPATIEIRSNWSLNETFTLE